MPEAVNPDGTRAVATVPFGIACYQGAVTDGVFNGTHCGVVCTVDDAERWLRGEDPLQLFPIYDGPPES